MNSIICLLFKISQQAVITARKYLSLLGTLNSTADLVILGRLHMAPLQFYLLAKWRPHQDSLDHYPTRSKVWVSPEVVDEPKHLLKGSSFERTPAGFSNIHRCQSRGLGGGSGGSYKTVESTGTRIVVRGRQTTSYQQSRNEGCLPAVQHWSRQIRGCCIMIGSTTQQFFLT